MYHTLRLVVLGTVMIMLLPFGPEGMTRAQSNSPGAPVASRAVGQYRKLSDGIVVKIRHGAAQKIRLKVVSANIIHVSIIPKAHLDLPKSLMAIRTGGDRHFNIETRHNHIRLSTPQVSADVNVDNGRVRFLDKHGKVILAARRDGSSFEPVTVRGKHFYAVRQQFNSPPHEAFYGLGQHQEGVMNYKGHDVILTQHNMNIAIPFVVSSHHYGVLWDNNSITRFGDPRSYKMLDKGHLKLFDAKGRPGGLTATYYVNGKRQVQRDESKIAYQHYHESYRDLPGWPARLGGVAATQIVNGTRAARNNQANRLQGKHSKKQKISLNGNKKVRVVWRGQVASNIAGLHKFRIYASGYSKVYIDGKQILDNWRQNSNPWYRNFRVRMTPGVKHSIRIVWIPQGGYIALKHLAPLPPREQNELSLFSEVARAINYYFINGKNIHDVIAGYRKVTGKSVMLPRWAYGFWQSRCCGYKNSKQLLGVVKRYRKLGLPLDNIVQDLQYWKPGTWGSHRFDRSRYPHPKKMIKKLHHMHTHLMVSVWPKFYPNTKNYKELAAHGDLYMRNIKAGQKDWLGHLYTYYDPYSKQARHLFWRQINATLGKLGVDAWWLDSDEPDIVPNHSIAERKRRMGPTAMGPGAEFFNSYPLLHTEAVYKGSRRDYPNKRVFILSRSAFAGQQRNAAASWSGDIVARWSNLRDQISAGVNFSMSGIPNWTSDIGGFMVEKRYQDQPTPAAQKEWRELQLRWFQFGAFCPIFRSHGVHPYREIYNIAPPGTPVYNALAWYDKLRYRLMPYIYTLAGDTYFNSATMMRGLVMDFPRDRRVRDISDEYMFGPAFLVAPVTHYKARSRKVYLPAGATWYDFYNGKRYHGGQSIKAHAPLARMPLFVHAGSIVPMGPAIEHTGQEPDAPITLYVYTGADGEFTLYNDQGATYDYEHGAYTEIPIHYNHKEATLSIGARRGHFSGMAKTRTFKIRWIDGASFKAIHFDAKPDRSIEYDGHAVVIHRSS